MPLALNDSLAGVLYLELVQHSEIKIIQLVVQLVYKLHQMVQLLLQLVLQAPQQAQVL